MKTIHLRNRRINTTVLIIIVGGAIICSGCVRRSPPPSSPHSHSAAPQIPAESQISHSDPVVKSVQEALIERGYRPGPADGIMGRKTKAALKNFQKEKNLQVTGRIDLRTKKLLLQEYSSQQVAHQVTTGKRVPLESAQAPDTVFEVSKQYIVREETELKVAEDPFSNTIQILPHNSFVTFVSLNGEWCQIEYQGASGYVMSEFLQRTEFGNHIETRPDEPKENTDKMAAALSEKAVVNAHPELSELSVNKQPGAAVEPEVIEKQAVQNSRFGVVNEKTDVMSKASTFSNIVMSITAGTKVEILETKNDFLKIRLGDIEGYIYADFVDTQD